MITVAVGQTGKKSVGKSIKKAGVSANAPNIM